MIESNDDAPTQRAQPGFATTAGGTLVSGQKIFARYVLEAQVGRGGMGVVWRARDEKLDRVIALKFLPPEVAADAEAVRDLKLETRRCLDLTHVNIVRVYDFIEEGAVAAIAMEYVEGESLAKLKAAAPGGCLAAADLTPFVAQLCAALRYAHHVARVAHHDLKPANVLVTREGVLKVTDFGIARSLSETQTRLTGKVGNTSGTLLYMSPQQLAGEKPTVADDIYALGASLYELLTGKPPFFRGDAVNLRQQVIEKTPAPLEAHRRELGFTGPEIPAAWSETILACLAKKPEDRPASADDVAARLGITLEPVTTARTTSPLSTSASRLRDPADALAAAPRRSLVPWLVGLGGLLVAAAGAAIYFGVYVPEQKRLAEEQEHARQAEFALRAARAHQAEEEKRLAEEKRQAAEAQAREQRNKEDAARAQAAKDQQDYSAIIATIAALPDNALPRQVNEAQRAIRTYLRTAPETYRDPVEKAWADRQAAWRAVAAASRPGSLVVETDPPGALVVLYPRNERKTSPALFEDVKPGDISLRVEKEGFESKDVPFVVKPGITNKLEPIKLAAVYGSIAITSDPPDLYVLVEGNGKRLEGHTPFTPASLPPGDYKVTYQPAAWRPQVKTVTVERGKQARLFADLKGCTLVFRSVPAGAQLTIGRAPLGVLTKPLTVSGVEPRDYVLTATLDGYENYSKTITVTRNDTIVIALAEKPLPHALRKLAGVRWHYESFSTDAELWFTVAGRITGTHRAVLSGAVRDVGTADSFNVATNTLTVHFTNNPNKSLYAGAVQIKLVDDDHLAVSWTAGGSAEHFVLERDKGQKP